MKKDTKKLQACKQLKKAHVYQLENKNQFIIEIDGFRCFQSYNSLVAVYNCATHELTLGYDWDYSNTTKKHLYIFINEYCALEKLSDALFDSKNKTKTINSFIKAGLILYDENMR